MKNKVSDRGSVVETELAQKPKKKMGGGMMKKKNYAKGGMMNKKNFAKGGKVIKGPYS